MKNAQVGLICGVGPTCERCSEQAEVTVVDKKRGLDLRLCRNCLSKIVKRGIEAPTTGLCTLISDGSLGWAIRKIIAVKDGAVTLNDHVSFRSPCFADAKVGQTWAVKHEGGGFAFGQVKTAICLEEAP